MAHTPKGGFNIGTLPWRTDLPSVLGCWLILGSVVHCCFPHMWIMALTMVHWSPVPFVALSK